MTTSCCMGSPTEIAYSLGDDTHAVVMGPMWAREHGLHADFVVQCVGGW